MNWNPHPDHNNRSKDHKHQHYEGRIVENIQAVYIIASLLWITLIYCLNLFKNDYIVWFLLLLPLVVFAINFISVGNFTCHMEDQMLRGNFLSFGFIVAIILINWNSSLDQTERNEFFKLLITAFILLMISLVDIWVDKSSMSVVKHIKTSLHTASLALLALALYLYYSYSTN